ISLTVILGIAGLTAAAYAAAVNGHGPDAIVEHVQNFHNHYFPEVLKAPNPLKHPNYFNDPHYAAAPNYAKDVLWKSTISLAFVVPLVGLIGLIGSKVAGLDWSARKTLVSWNYKIFGLGIYLLYHRIAKWTALENLLRSARLGISPITRVTPSSAIGREFNLTKTVFPALNTPFFWENVDRNADILAALSVEKDRSASTALILSLIALGDQNGLSSEEIAKKLKSGEIPVDAENLSKFANDAKSKNILKQTAVEINESILKIKEVGESQRLIDISEATLIRCANIAKQKAAEIQKRSLGGKALANAKKIANVPAAISKFLANWTVEEHRFLMRTEPDEFLPNLVWQQFTVDITFATGLIAVEGPRANLDDPQALAARPGRFAWTNPGHLADSFDQIMIYLVLFPGRTALQYQKVRDRVSTRYKPIESITYVNEKGETIYPLKGNETHEGYIKGMLAVANGIVNPLLWKEADWGGQFIRNLQKKQNTLQIYIPFLLMSKMVFGHQPLGQALGAATYFLIWAEWMWGYPWTLNNRGLQFYEERYQEKADKFLKAKSVLAQGLRLDDLEKIIAGSKSLAEDYEKATKSDEFKAMLKTIQQTYEKFTPTQLAQMQSVLSESLEVTAQLRENLATGNPDKIAQAEKAVIQLYEKSGKPISGSDQLKLHGIKLLKKALEEPPFATAINPGVPWTMTWICAAATTLGATVMAVKNFRPDQVWAPQLINVTLKATALYGGLWLAQRYIFDHIPDGWMRAKEMANSTPENFAAKYLESRSNQNHNAANSALPGEVVKLPSESDAKIKFASKISNFSKNCTFLISELSKNVGKKFGL
ncbi:MAG: hypothetical protein JWQ35_831, partial [Bacteriovoracaceae bacterium]|nr:hypothetical protein [Bacteriovoracaceae bacterium]